MESRDCHGRILPNQPLERRRPAGNPVADVFRFLFGIKGRAARSDWVLIEVVIIPISFIPDIIGIDLSTDIRILGLLLLSSLFFGSIDFAVTIRRLHDLGHSGWWILGSQVLTLVWTVARTSGNLIAIGIAASLLATLWLWLGTTQGDTGRNRYGSERDSLLAFLRRQQSSA
jgi:uncharacterized membrane protein YhaH (DUF805 family)